MYYYDVIYKIKGKWRYMYVISMTFYKNGEIPFLKDKKYPKSWTDVKSYIASTERMKFIKCREKKYA